jgi:hypothetical protein
MTISKATEMVPSACPGWINAGRINPSEALIRSPCFNCHFSASLTEIAATFSQHCFETGSGIPLTRDYWNAFLFPCDTLSEITTSMAPARFRLQADY